MTKNLKVYQYKGCQVCIRHLGLRNYETLIVFRGKIHVYQVNVMKPKKNDKRVSQQEMDDGVIGELMNASAQLIDGFKRERSVKNILKTNLQHYGKKATNIIGNIRKSLGVSGRGQGEPGIDAGREV